MSHTFNRTNFKLFWITILLSGVMRFFLQNVVYENDLLSLNLFGFILIISYTFFINTIFLLADNRFVKFCSSAILLFGILFIAIDIVLLNTLVTRLDQFIIVSLIKTYPMSSVIACLTVIFLSVILAIKQPIVTNKLMKLSLIPVGVFLLVVGTTPFANPLTSISDWDIFVNRLPLYSKTTPELPSFLRLTINYGRLDRFNDYHFYFNSHFYSMFLTKFNKMHIKTRLKQQNFNSNKVYSHGAFKQEFKPGLQQNSKQYFDIAIKSDIEGIETDGWYVEKDDEIYLTHDAPSINNNHKFMKLTELINILESKRDVRIWIDLKNRKRRLLDLFVNKMMTLKISPSLKTRIYIEHPDPFLVRKLAQIGFNTIWSLSYGVPSISMPIDSIRSLIAFSQCEAVSYRWECVTKELVRGLNNFPVFTYTINDPQKIKELAGIDAVKAIVTDLDYKEIK